MSGVLAKSLQGLKVLDASRVLAGPFAAQTLADLGATVIKVEDPRAGDETRGWGPPFQDGDSAYFLSANRGKRSVAIDLKHGEGAALFRRLAQSCDILLENFRTDSAAALGLSAKALHALNPRLIICSLSGFGRTGTMASRPGYDFVVQGLTGLMAATGPRDGQPYKAGIAAADLMTGLYASTAILAAVQGRAQTGQGYAIEIALVDCGAAAMSTVAQSYLMSHKVPGRQGNAHQQIVPYEMFATADGWLILAIGNDQQWAKFCAVAGATALAQDERFKTNAGRVGSRVEVVSGIGKVVAQRPTAEWEALLAAAGVPAGPVWTVGEFFESDFAAERGLKVTVRRADGTAVDLVKSPLVDVLPDHAIPPRLGEHTGEVLAELLGIDAAEFDRLRASGACR